LTIEDIILLRRQLTERSILLKEGLERMRQTQDELESTKRRRDETESRLATLEAEYEELLGERLSTSVRQCHEPVVQRKQFRPSKQAMVSMERSQWLN
jgi:hypothetical protein